MITSAISLVASKKDAKLATISKPCQGPQHVSIMRGPNYQEKIQNMRTLYKKINRGSHLFLCIDRAAETHRGEGGWWERETSFPEHVCGTPFPLDFSAIDMYERLDNYG